jgi:hypothetical protein
MTKYQYFGLFCLVTLNGCASLISGSYDEVAFTSSPNSAAFNIKDENGKTVHQGTTPASVVLERSDGYLDGQTYQVSFSAPGYLPKTESLDTTFNGWYFGNLIFGGLIGLVVLDPATGAMWDLPSTMDVKLSAQ